MSEFENLVRKLREDKEFFSEYKDIFRNALFKHLQGNRRGMLSSDSINILIDRLYLLLFSLDRNPLRELESLFYRLAHHELDIKDAVSKALLGTLKDYIDYTVERERPYERVKALVALIDLYISTIEKAYSRYTQELREKVKVADRTRVEGEVGIIVDFFQRQLELNKRSVEVLSFYKEVPIVCRSKVLEVEDINLVLKQCELRAFSPGSEIYIKHVNLPKTVAVRVVDINNRDELMEVQVLGFTELPQERRRYVRVVPKERIQVVLSKGNWSASGFVADISLGGIGIFTKDIDSLKEGDFIKVKFNLPKGEVEADAQVRHVEEREGMYRLGMSYQLDIKKEEVVSDYIMERQFEILKELRGS